jgi:hypothetical protein
MTATDIKIKAQALRARGYTFTEIKKFLGVNIPQSTLSYWCKNVKLPLFYYEKIKKINEISRIKGQKALKISRDKKQTRFFSDVKKQNKRLLTKFKKDKDIKKIALAILYLGEGSKWKSHRGLMLGSSDPGITKLYIRLLKDIYSIPKDSLRGRILYRADQNIKELTRFWSKITGLKNEYFYKTKPDSRTIGKPTKNKEYKGVCVISCAGTKNQLELEIIAKMICMGL